MLQIPRIDGASPISNILKNFNAFDNIPPKIGTNFTWMKRRKVDRKKYYQKIPFLFNLQWSTTFLSCFRNCVFTNNLKETNNPSLSCDIRCMISILKVDGDHTATAASLHTNTMTLYWKVSLGEWREETGLLEEDDEEDGRSDLRVHHYINLKFSVIHCILHISCWSCG